MHSLPPLAWARAKACLKRDTAKPFQSEAAMLTVLQILTRVHPTLLTHVCTTINFPNSPYMALTVENIGPGPKLLPALSLCHYGEQNGDAMRDPEMCFEMEIKDGRLKGIGPYYYRNDYVGREEFAHDQDSGAVDTGMVGKQKEFADLWGRNLKEQGFLRGYPEAAL